MSFAKFVIGDKSGNRLAELTPEIGPISWRMNNVGKCTFSIAKTDPKAIEDYLRYGNKVLIEFANGLPNWGGVIDPPRKWDGNNIECTAYSAAQIFRHRQTDKGRYFEGASVGAIFQSLIEDANYLDDTGVKIGEIFIGGTGHSPDYHYKELLTIFQDSLTKRLSDYDYDFIGSESGGKIIFTANLYEKKGSDKSQIALVSGENLSKTRLIEQGPIINWWDAAGEGTDWGSTRLTSNNQDKDSLSIYGLRQGSRVYSDTSNQGTLDNNSLNLLNEFKDPYNIFELDALDELPAKFTDYDLGDTISLVDPDLGFGGTDTIVRIIGRSFFPVSGVCELVVQEVD